MNLEELYAELEEMETKRESILKKIQEAESVEDVNKLELELVKEDIAIQEVVNEIEAVEIENEEENGTDGEEEPEEDEVRKRKLRKSIRNRRPSTTSKRSNPLGSLRPLGTYSMNKVEKREKDEDIYSSLEYRKAFRDYMVEGKQIPKKFTNTEKRAGNALTTIGDIGAVIPTTIQNKVIEDLTVEGKIIARITQTSYEGGTSIPVSEMNVTASWINSETKVSDEQKAGMGASVTFSYHVLEARIAIGLLSATVSLPMFENTVVEQLKKAMIRGIETSVINGTGTGQPLGFTKYNLPTEQVIEMSEDTVGTVKAWAKVEAAIPEAYEDKVIYLMSKATWENYLNGMTDTTGQRIGLGKINEKGERILNGREVLVVDKLTAFDKATDGEIFAAAIDLSQYCLNSNLSMYYKKYFDEDANKWVHKSLMIADGKMAIGETGTGVNKRLVGAEGLIYIKKVDVVTTP